MKLIPKNEYYIQYASRGKRLHRIRRRHSISAEQYNRTHLDSDHPYYNASIDSIIKMQTLLKSKGLYNGTIDGRWGPLTEAAYKKDKTLSSFDIFFKQAGLSKEARQQALLRLPSKSIDRNGNLTNQCAAYVNKVLDDNGIESYGDAPAINKQFKEVYSGYSDIDSKEYNVNGLPIKERTDSILSMHHRAARNVANKLNVNNLDKTHVYTVNMYFGQNRKNASPYLNEFYDKGIKDKSPGSHEGVLYYNPNNGWMVNHSIHGKIKNEPLNNLLGDKRLYGIISVADAGKIKDKSISQMKKEEQEKKAIANFYQYDISSPYIGPHFYKGGKLIPKAQWGLFFSPLSPINIGMTAHQILSNKHVRNAASALKSNILRKGNVYDSSDNYRDIISKEFNLSPKEFDLIQQVLPHIAKRESTNGKGFDYNFRNSIITMAGPDAAEDLFNVAKRIKRGEKSPLSVGPYQMKYDIFVNDPAYKNMFNKYRVSKNDIIKNNDKATLAALIKLAGDYNVLKTQKLINKNGKEIPYEDALKFVWHYGPQHNWQKVEVLNDRYVRDKLF